MSVSTCDLCGLSLGGNPFTQQVHDQQLSFCCAGCRMVYAMLLEAADAPDPSRFKETDLYRRCVAAGVIPSGEADQKLQEAPSLTTGVSEPTDSTKTATLALHLRVAGMWCPACAWVIQTCAQRLLGVISAHCDFATDRLGLRYDPTRISPTEIRTAVERLGYALDDSADPKTSPGLRREWIRLAVSGLMAVNCMMLSWALYSGFFMELGVQAVRYLSWPIWAMATVVLIYGGLPLFRKAWGSLRARAPGMEVLIVLGAGSAYLYSLYNLRSGSLHLYFDTSAMLITLVLLGKLLEALARQRIRQDLDHFLSLRPSKVRRCSDAFPLGRWISIDQLEVGHLFRVESEEILAADGRVVEGEASLELSAVTGEAQPLEVSRGALVVSGSRLTRGSLRIEAQKVGDDALIGQMTCLVQTCLSHPSRVDDRAQRLLTIFVPGLLGLAALTAIIGHGVGLTVDQALVRAVTVLVIACPCSLGIAMPLARVAGLAQAGRLGLLVRSFDAFEISPKIDTVVLDKTGTVTMGSWEVSKIELHGDLSEAQTVGLALGLEERSTHAAARAIGEYGLSNAIPPIALDKVSATADGIRGWWEGHQVKIGTLKFIVAEACDSPGPARTESRVYLGVDATVCATFFFADRLRHQMPFLVAQLQRNGLETHLISGDADPTTQSVAAAIGIPLACGGLLPMDKADYIQQLQRKGKKVVMIGDGVNDAPAMARADLALAIHSGAHLSGQVADVLLMRGDPLQLLDWLFWSKKVNAKVGQNLGWAWAYNLIAIPMAMAGGLTPIVAVAAMLLSSLTVIGNTLSLTRSPRRTGKVAP